MDMLRDWIAFIGVLSASALGLAGVLGLAYRLTLMRRMDRLDRALKSVEYHLVPNGGEDDAHPDDRGQPLRTLLMRTRRDVRDIDGRLAHGNGWMRDHDIEHLRRDPAWPVERA